MSGAKDLGYLGKQFDKATGLYNYGYRDYKPDVARFTTVDPIRDGANWVVYCDGDPVNFVDLWGLSASDGNKLSQNNIDKINTLHPEIRNNTTQMLENLKKRTILVEITLAYRSYEEQNALYAQGRNEKGEVTDASKVVTNAKGGQSYHNFGLAFDVSVYDNDGNKNWNKDSDSWKAVIEEGKKQGFEAGAEWDDFPDLPHFQNTFGFMPKSLREKKDKNEMTDGFVNVK